MRIGPGHAAVIALTLCAGCGRGPFGQGRDASADGGDGPTSTDDGADGTSAPVPPPPPPPPGSTGEPVCTETPEGCSIVVSLRRAVDILFVIDNSGSMGDEQGVLARNFRNFIDVLEGQEVGANYRIAITTTSRDGQLRATTCRSRLFEFVFNSQLGSLDERQRGCLDVCDLETLPIPQPWVEKSGTVTNLPPGVTMAQALSCIGPQGINGSGFEAPLEAMRNALQDQTTGFLREDALLAVVFVSDEADCSMPLDSEFWITSPDGGVFWSTPERATSAVCWNAGVTCTGGPGIYDDCVPADKNRQGLPTVDPNDAVMFPVQRYIDTLADLAAAKVAVGGRGEVLIATLSGVPLDFPDTGIIVYQDSDFPEFNQEYGIGPGCDRGTETILAPPGIPPVRMRAFAEAFATDRRNMFSICAGDYGVAMQEIAESIGEINERACVGGCVTDLEPGLPGLTPDCTLVEQFPIDSGLPDRLVPPCLTAGDVWDFPGPLDDVCFLEHVDPDGSTPQTLDDLTPQCVTRGSNLEYLVQRRAGVPVPSGTVITVQCQLEGEPGIACEDL